MTPPLLLPPVDLSLSPITHGFWVDETNNPLYKDFYTVFNGHHPGVDINLPKGSPLHASLGGIVVRQETHPGMGNVLATRLGNIYVLYAHLSSVNVKLSDTITPGQTIALSGNTGQATHTPHLHFELRDLRQTDLSQMVFEPVFNKAVSRHQEEFVYTVNNQNQPKTFQNLALRYFGSANFASFLKLHNPLLTHYEVTSTLPHCEKIIIPSA